MYESLVEQGESSISEIALSAGVHRRNAYDAIQRLIDKGLCFQIIASGENKYNAVDPDKLTELLAEKQLQLQQILPDLKKKFGERIAPEEAYIYRGIEGQKNIFRDILRTGKDSYFIGAKAGWMDPRLDAARAEFFKEVKRKKITLHGLFDYELQSRPDLVGKFNVSIQHRFLPKGYSTSSGVQIFDDYVVSYTNLGIGVTSDKVVFFVVRSHSLAESYRTWFQFMWKCSPPK
jgi:sugar-specific transcriptional regulator TrmB